MKKRTFIAPLAASVAALIAGAPASGAPVDPASADRVTVTPSKLVSGGPALHLDRADRALRFAQDHSSHDSHSSHESHSSHDSHSSHSSGM